MGKVAILTFHRALNAGAVLQAWALQTVLQRLGHGVEFPDCNGVGQLPRFAQNWYKKDPPKGVGRFALLKFRLLTELEAFGVEDLRRLRYGRFVSRHLNVRKMKRTDIARRYAAVVVGSDQVWNVAIARRDAGLFLLSDVSVEGLACHSYAISAGDAPPSPAAATALLEAAKRFECLSLREPIDLPLVDGRGNSPVVEPDPTLLLRPDDYAAVACPRRLERGPYLLVYSLTYHRSFRELARKTAAALGIRPVFVIAYQYGWHGMDGRSDTRIAVSPDRLLAYVRDAAAVMTTMFHGAALSLVYDRPFSVLPAASGKIPMRCRHLLETIGESWRGIVQSNDADALSRALTVGLGEEAKRRISSLTAAALERLSRI